ncbi:MAG: hypothetical protein WCJ01_11780 [Ignavibacteria bacterium]
MGYSTLLDIVGSTIMGGLLLLILMRVNGSSVQNTYDLSGERMVQQNIIEVVSLLEYDLRKIGYCNDYTQLPDPAVAIIKADSTSIWFLTDIVEKPDHLFGDGVLDTMKYYLGTTSELTATPNPNDRYLYRVVNSNTAKGVNLGVTQFKLTYFDVTGSKLTTLPVSPPFGIASIQIDVGVENPAAYGQDYSYQKRAIWRQVRLASRNFMLR